MRTHESHELLVGQMTERERGVEIDIAARQIGWHIGQHAEQCGATRAGEGWPELLYNRRATRGSVVVSSSMNREPAAGSRRERVTIAIGALLLLAVCAYRASLGISFVDDAHNAAITLRLAEGARPFADEMTTQALGFLLAVPFAKAWTALFGLTGYVLALRLFYVAVSAAVTVVVYRLLRPSFGAIPAALGAVTPFLVPPYNIFGVSYNTMAMLGLVLSVALCLASVRENSPRLAVAAGASAAFAAISYPPLALGALVLAGSYAAVARKRRLIVPALGGAAAVVAMFSVWVLATVQISEIQRSLEYASSVWQGYRSPADKVVVLLRFARRALITRWTLPAWALGAVAGVPALGRQTRAVAAALVPVACLVPAARVFASGNTIEQFGTNGAAYLILFTATAAFPVVVNALVERDADSLRGLALAAPLAVVGYFVVAYSTSSGWLSAMPVIAVAPFATIVLAGWSRLAATGRAARVATSVLVTGVLVVLLFATAFKDSPPLALRSRFASGALAGIATTPTRTADIERIVAAGARWSKPSDRVLVVGRPLGYLLVPGTAHTNAIWLVTGPSDQYTVDYFSRTAPPDVVYINRSVMSSAGGLEAAARIDPLVSFLSREYTLVETFDPFSVFVRR